MPVIAAHPPSARFLISITSSAEILLFTHPNVLFPSSINLQGQKDMLLADIAWVIAEVCHLTLI